VLFESQNLSKNGAAKQTVQTDEFGTPVSDPMFTCNESSHDLRCVPDNAQIGREQARVLVESRVLKGELSLSSAVGQVVRQLSVQHGRDEACLFPSSFSMKRTMNRKLEIVFGPSPWSMANLTKIPGNFSYTKSDEPFLLVFRNYYKPDGSFVGPILVFATNEDLRQLFQPSGGAWLVDGTFKTKPYPYARIRAFWRSPYSLEISNIASRVTGNARG